MDGILITFFTRLLPVYSYSKQNIFAQSRPDKLNINNIATIKFIQEKIAKQEMELA